MAKDARQETTMEAVQTTSEQVAELAARAGLEKKAAQVRVLDVRGLASYADYLVLMSASSDRQVEALADAVDDSLRKAGHRPLGVEGQGTGHWVLLDAGDVVVHVFHEEARSFYDLDGLWADARPLHVSEPARAGASA